MTRELALVTLVSGMAVGVCGCHPVDHARDADLRMSMIGRDEAELRPQPSTGRGTFKAVREVDAENALLELNASNRCFEIQNAQGKRALLMVGPIHVVYTADGLQNVEYPYKGRVSYDAGGAPEASMESGWSYAESQDMAGPFRPTMRTRRVVASSSGTSALIFSEGSTRDIIINPAAGGGVLKVEKIGNASQSVTLNPGEFVVFTSSFGRATPLPTEPPGNDTDRFTARAYWLNEFATREIARTRPPQ